MPPFQLTQHPTILDQVILEIPTKSGAAKYGLIPKLALPEGREAGDILTVEEFFAVHPSTVWKLVVKDLPYYFLYLLPSDHICSPARLPLAPGNEPSSSQAMAPKPSPRREANSKPQAGSTTTSFLNLPLRPASEKKAPVVTKMRATMDPAKPLTDVTFEELDSVDVESDAADDGELRAPFYVAVQYFDTSKADENVPAGPEDSESWFGPYHCVQEANDAATLLAIDNYRTLQMRYYNSLDGTPSLRIRPAERDGDGTGLMMVEPMDPGNRFWLCATATNEEPVGDVEDAYIVKQAWDVFLVTLLTTGGARNKVITPDKPVIKHKVSISRNNANKYAAQMFREATEFLLPDPKRKEFVDAIKKMTDDAEKKMMAEADKSYEWVFQKNFTSQMKITDEHGNEKSVQTYVRLSVQKFDTDP